MSHIVYKVEAELEADGRWIAEIVDVPGVLAYAATEKEAVASAQALALRVLLIASNNRSRLPVHVTKRMIKSAYVAEAANRSD